MFQKQCMRMRLKNLSKKSAYFLSVAVIGLMVGLSIQLVRAWNPPTASAPGGNVEAPITTAGGQTINGTLKVKSLEVENGGTITLGNKAKSTWPVLYTPGTENISSSKLFVVPDGVTKLHIEAWGGGGGGAAGRVTTAYGWIFHVTAGGSGGSGGYAYFDLPVVAGQELWIQVGRGGYGAYRIDDFTTPGFRSEGGAGGLTAIMNYDSWVSYASVYGGAPGWDIDRYQDTISWCEGVRVAGGVATSSIAGAVLKNGNAGNPCTYEKLELMSCGGGDGPTELCWWPALINPSGNAAPAAVSSSLIPSTGAFGRGGGGVSGGAYSDAKAVSPFGAARGEDGEDGRVIITW